MVVQVCFIFAIYLLTYFISSVYFPLEDVIDFFFWFFSGLSYIGESEFVNQRRLYILSLNSTEFIIPIVIHGFFLCL